MGINVRFDEHCIVLFYLFKMKSRYQTYAKSTHTHTHTFCFNAFKTPDTGHMTYFGNIWRERDRLDTLYS